MARRYLLSERLRLVISVLGVAFAVVLVAVVLALYRGWSGIGEIVTDLPGRLWVAQAGTVDPFHAASVLEESTVRAITAEPDVALAIPVRARQTGFAHDNRLQRLYLMALDPTNLSLLSDAARTRFAADVGTIIVDRVFSRKMGVQEGDFITINGVSLRVARVTEGGNAIITQFAFIHWDDAARLFGPLREAAFVLLEPRASVTPKALQTALQARYPQTQIYTSEEFAQSIRDEIDERFLPVIAVILTLGLVVGGAVVGLTIYTMTIERRREYGVLKAIGADRGALIRLVLTQSFLLSVAGFAVGLAGTVAVAALAEWAVPEFITVIRAPDVAVILGAAVAVAVLAAVVPVRRIAEIDPAVVFRA